MEIPVREKLLERFFRGSNDASLHLYFDDLGGFMSAYAIGYIVGYVGMAALFLWCIYKGIQKIGGLLKGKKI